MVGVFTAEDIPGQNKVGHLVKDWDTMIAVGDITHYLGDAICLVAAETPEILAQAKALVKVDYEELPTVRSPRGGHAARRAPGPPDREPADATSTSQRGNAGRGHRQIEICADPALLHTRGRSTPSWSRSAPWPMPDGDGGHDPLTTDQGAYDTQHETMGMLGLPAEKVKVRNCLVGGGFGGKEDVTVQHHAALIAYLTKRAGEGEAHAGGEHSDPPQASPASRWSSPSAATRTASSRA